jgi:hypothetical protein
MIRTDFKSQPSCRFAIFGTLALLSLLLAPRLHGQQTRADSMRVMMGPMQEIMGPIMERMIVRTFEATIELLAKPETADRLATYVKNFHDALVAKGFTKEEALRIVSAMGIPYPGGSR